MAGAMNMAGHGIAHDPKADESDGIGLIH
jgi:hypothetical protein